MQKFYSQILLISLVLLISGCAKDEPGGMSDAELVQAIIDAEGKVEVAMEDLPTAARSNMEENYLNDYLHLYSMKASMFGYEVSIGGRAGNSGKRGEVYFDIDGRKLDPEDYGDHHKGWYGERDGFDRDNFGEKRNWNCFDIVYPIAIMMPNGSSYLIDSEEDSDLETIKSYYEENGGADERPSIIFPVNIIDHEGEIRAINSEEEMADAYRQCSGRDRDWEKRDCFGLVFPITYIMPDGSSYEIADADDESWAEIKAWYEANPEAEERPELQYPVDIMYESEDRIVTISNEEEMLAAKEGCREMWDADEEEWEECFDYVYPIAFTMPNGSSIEISNDDETSWMSIRAYYEANPSDEEPVLEYPIDIISRTEDGEVTFTMDSEEDVDSFVEENCERP